MAGLQYKVGALSFKTGHSVQMRARGTETKHLRKKLGPSQSQGLGQSKGRSSNEVSYDPSQTSRETLNKHAASKNHISHLIGEGLGGDIHKPTLCRAQLHGEPPHSENRKPSAQAPTSKVHHTCRADSATSSGELSEPHTHDGSWVLLSKLSRGSRGIPVCTEMTATGRLRLGQRLFRA